MAVFVGDIGVQLKLDAGIDISSNTTLRIRYEKPDKTVGFWTATVSDTNFALYTTLEDDLDQGGEWVLQIFIITSSYTAHGQKATLEVIDPIPVS